MVLNTKAVSNPLSTQQFSSQYFDFGKDFKKTLTIGLPFLRRTESFFLRHYRKKQQFIEHIQVPLLYNLLGASFKSHSWHVLRLKQIPNFARLISSFNQEVNITRGGAGVSSLGS